MSGIKVLTMNWLISVMCVLPCSFLRIQFTTSWTEITLNLSVHIETEDILKYAETVPQVHLFVFTLFALNNGIVSKTLFVVPLFYFYSAGNPAHVKNNTEQVHNKEHLHINTCVNANPRVLNTKMPSTQRTNSMSSPMADLACNRDSFSWLQASSVNRMGDRISNHIVPQIHFLSRALPIGDRFDLWLERSVDIVNDKMVYMILSGTLYQTDFSWRQFDYSV